MTSSSLASRIQFAPRAVEPAAAARTWEALADADAEAAARLRREDAARDLLTGVFGCAPYLARAAVRRAEPLADMLEADPEDALGAILARARVEEGEDAAALGRRLRAAKLDLHLLAAVADVGRAWTLAETTGAITRFADAAVDAALRFHAGEVGTGGMTVLAMGKQGAGELNYSSDIDLIVLFDRERIEQAGVADAQSWASKTTRAFVKTLEELTGDGYVFRTDLRLRPDPGATPPAVNLASALHYYEALGQTWERSAFIKARACAGDLELGRSFLDELGPFVWRKSLDYAALDDLHAMKRQVQTHAGGLRPLVPGADVKRGYGGIREIEFFVQAQQLIYGGRDPRLRATGTVDALRALVEAGHVDAETAGVIGVNYRVLRDVEHRIQMINDAQTHTVPEAHVERDRVAALFGAESLELFDGELRARIENVRERTDELFSDADLDRPKGFEIGAVEDDEASLAALQELGFERPALVTQSIRAWRAGRAPATRSTRARALLGRVVPDLIAAAAATGAPDAAFVRFSEFFENLPAGVQTLSMFASEPAVLRAVVDVLSISPKLGVTLARQPELLDVMIEGDFRRPVVETTERDAARVAQTVAATKDFEGALNAARRTVREARFRIGVQSLLGVIDADGAGRAHAVLAEATIAALLEASQAELTRRHGPVDGAFAVLGLGKLGGRELSFGSDLDLVAVYASDVDAVTPPGGIGPDTYFARLTQRLITALSASTEEGDLYEVDMQLRPSGNAGPIAARLSAFEAYYADAAWTWELMALTRARPVAGAPDLCARLEEMVRAILSQPRDADEVRRNVADMRRRMAAERSARGDWDLKLSDGGLVDIEFTLQTLQLLSAADAPEVLSPSSREAIGCLAAAGVLSADDTSALGRALELQLSLTQVLSVGIEGVLNEETAPARLKDRLVAAGGAESFAALAKSLKSARRDAREVFERLVLKPAADATE
ncbi:MAG: bifunctional [glutamine synthetase] adenylyltransferase/[glutamine synthetase]-adenylyl-L-tyrosine phosphorylase [Maricaulaceae bacterium]|jgi:glutamate-ammonia-ligase adenylyltransferase